MEEREEKQLYTILFDEIEPSQKHEIRGGHFTLIKNSIMKNFKESLKKIELVFRGSIEIEEEKTIDENLETNNLENIFSTEKIAEHDKSSSNEHELRDAALEEYKRKLDVDRQRAITKVTEKVAYEIEQYKEEKAGLQTELNSSYNNPQREELEKQLEKINNKLEELNNELLSHNILRSGSVFRNSENLDKEENKIDGHIEVPEENIELSVSSLEKEKFQNLKLFTYDVTVNSLCHFNENYRIRIEEANENVKKLDIKSEKEFEKLQKAGEIPGASLFLYEEIKAVDRIKDKEYNDFLYKAWMELYPISALSPDEMSKKFCDEFFGYKDSSDFFDEKGPIEERFTDEEKNKWQEQIVFVNDLKTKHMIMLVPNSEIALKQVLTVKESMGISNRDDFYKAKHFDQLAPGLTTYEQITYFDRIKDPEYESMLTLASGKILQQNMGQLENPQIGDICSGKFSEEMDNLSKIEMDERSIELRLKHKIAVDEYYQDSIMKQFNSGDENFNQKTR